MTGTSDFSLGYWEQPNSEEGFRVVAPIGISQDEFEAYGRAIGAYEAVAQRRLYWLLNRNWNRLKSMRDLYANVEKVGGSFRHIDQQSLTMSFMGEVINWLAATRLYLENNRHFLAEHLGEDDDGYKGYLEITHEVFDSNPAYRFLYNLRDYSQHCGPPLGGFAVSAAKVQGRRSLELFINRSELLQASFKWKSHAKELIEQWSEKIILLPLIDEAMRGFHTIERHVLGSLLDKCVDVLPLLREGVERAGTTSGFPAIFNFRVSDGVEMSYQSFPRFEDLERIQQLAASKDRSELLSGAEGQDLERNSERDHAESQAIAVISGWIEHGPGERLDELVNGILREDEGVTPLVYGLINISVYSITTLAKALGGTPQSILGGFKPNPDGA